MDLSKFKTSDWLKIGGALGFLIFGFFDWVTVKSEGINLGGGGNVFDFFWTGILPWLLVLATGVLTFLLVNGNLKAGNRPWPLIFLAATALAALLLLIRLLFNPLDGKDTIESFGGEVGRGIGMILSVISGLIAFAGALLGFKESGGSLNDLTDMNKVKSQFGGSGSGSGTIGNSGLGGSSGTRPPPPPPGMTPPPPPPPPPPAGTPPPPPSR